MPTPILGVRERALMTVEVRGVLEPLRDYRGRRGLPSAKLEILRDDAGVFSVLADLVKSGVVRAHARMRSFGGAQW